MTTSTSIDSPNGYVRNKRANRVLKRCECCQVGITLPKKRSYKKSAKARKKAPGRPRKVVKKKTLKVKKPPIQLKCKECVVRVKKIDLEKWFASQKQNTDEVQDDFLVSNKKPIEVQNTEIITICLDDDDDDDDCLGGVPSSTQNDSKTNGSVDGQLFSKVEDLSSVVYLGMAERQRAQNVFPNYSQEKVDFMRSFFTDPSAKMKPFAKLELLEPIDALKLMKLPQLWLNCKVMNSYFMLIEEATNGLVKCYKSYHVLSTKTMNKRLVMKFHTLSVKVGKTLFSKTALFIPFNLFGCHWILIIVHLINKTVIVFDSLRMCSDYMYDILRDVHEHLCLEAKRFGAVEFDPNGWDYDLINSPEQLNSYDCGVFVCSYAWNMIRTSNGDFDQSDIPLIRQRMSYELIQGKLIQ